MIVRFEADPQVMLALTALGERPEVIVPANGRRGLAQVHVSPALDAALLDLIERLVDIRLAYIDGRQRQYQLPLPLDDA